MDLSAERTCAGQAYGVFLQYWAYLMGNMVDLLPTVMTMHQAPAIDVLHALEQRTADLRDRLYDEPITPCLPFVPPLPFKTAKPSNKLKWDMCGLENIQYQPMDAAHIAETPAPTQSITTQSELSQLLVSTTETAEPSASRNSLTAGASRSSPVNPQNAKQGSRKRHWNEGRNNPCIAIDEMF